jgi:hypothetical protein
MMATSSPTLSGKVSVPAPLAMNLFHQFPPRDLHFGPQSLVSAGHGGSGGL